ncbi:SNF2-related protein [Paracoccus sp. (in: a-proteobacteria)]|uniref:DEAD/DEAH box helicase n=1 Tax=Paracoccus sp. TaxID=267 RepID=UPI003A8B41C6
MTIRLDRIFDKGTLERGLNYARRDHVVSIDVADDGLLHTRVANGRGRSYRQQISVGSSAVEGFCTCPVGYNCKHVAAAMVVWMERQGQSPSLSPQYLGWLGQIKKCAVPDTEKPEARPEDYPDKVNARLLYVLIPHGQQVKIDIYKGQINAARTGLNKSIRRHDVSGTLRGGVAEAFIRPVDLDLLTALARAGLWDCHSGYGLPEFLRPAGGDAAAVIQRLCATGRFLHDNLPDAQLTWSGERPEPELGWTTMANGKQRLIFQDGQGQPLDLRMMNRAMLWVDAARGLIGEAGHCLSDKILRIVQSSPEVEPLDVAPLAEALPKALAGLTLPAPRTIRQTRRAAKQQVARLVLGAETARQGGRYHGQSVQLPTLTLQFMYDGQQVHCGDDDPRLVENGDVVVLARDHRWEADCAARLQEAGALPVSALEFHRPGERMQACGFAFAEGELNCRTQRVSTARDGIEFAFHVVPELQRDGWQIEETKKWPFLRGTERAVLSVETRSEAGAAFQGNDWFSLGFQAEIGGYVLDVAALIAAFLEQARLALPGLLDLDTLTRYLAERPIWLDRGKQGYVPLDLGPVAPLLHLFLTHHTQLGALHPAEADIAGLAEEALEGSSIRFADHAGILPLARSLRVLAKAQARDFVPPRGLTAKLRDYQAFGVAWMMRLLETGFGGVLADDMGLGKTIQTLALLQTRHEAGAPGPALLIVPTSLLHGWQTQAAQFTPGLRLVILHGQGRAALHDQVAGADLVITTYPLLARDRDWLAEQDWPLVILDEAQTLKNPASLMAKALRDIPAKGRLALTGTPLENSLQDLWTLTDWVNPGLLGDRKRFQTLFRTPIEKQGDMAAQARLNRRLRPFLLRRTKEQVAAELPPRTQILDRVDLPKTQQALYETVRSAMDARVREAIAARGLAASRITVLDALLKLRQVCCDPVLVKTDAARSVDSAKRARLGELLAELMAENRRVLVFSQFVEMLRLIETDLSAAGIPFLSLTGQTRNRAEVLDRFARGEAPVFLLSLKAGGLGLTLTEADTVILYDPWWNPAVERQAMDRTHRIGQTKPVFVHRLVAAGTVEEKILEMQARKQALADALFDESCEAADMLLNEATLQDLFAPLQA